MKTKFALPTIALLSGFSTSQAEEVTPAWQSDGFVMDEIVVTAAVPERYLMEEVVVTATVAEMEAAMAAVELADANRVSAGVVEEIVAVASREGQQTRSAVRSRNTRSGRRL